MLFFCLALKKVDTKVNKNEYKRSTDKEWQEKDKPRSQNGDSAGVLSRGAAQPKCAGKEIWDRDNDKYKSMAKQELAYIYYMADPRSDYQYLIDSGYLQFQVLYYPRQ